MSLSYFFSVQPLKLLLLSPASALSCLPRNALPMCFATTGSHVDAASTVQTRPHTSGASLRTSVIQRFCEIELSLQSPAHFADSIFQRFLKRKSSSCYGPVHFLSTTFPDRPHFGDPWSRMTRKNTGSCACARSQTVTVHFPTT